MTVVPLFTGSHADLSTSVSTCPYVKLYYQAKTVYYGVCPACGFGTQPGSIFQASNRIARHIVYAKRREMRRAR